MLPISCAALITTLPCINASARAQRILGSIPRQNRCIIASAIAAHDVSTDRLIQRQVASGFFLQPYRINAFRDFMTAELQSSEPATAAKTAQSHINSAESSMIAEHAGDMPLSPCDPNGRRLRNRLLLANVVAWIVIVIVIRLIFF